MHPHHTEGNPTTQSQTSKCALQNKQISPNTKHIFRTQTSKLKNSLTHPDSYYGMVLRRFKDLIEMNIIWKYNKVPKVGMIFQNFLVCLKVLKKLESFKLCMAINLKGK